MQIFVKRPVFGILILEVESSETIKSVKRRIQLEGFGSGVQLLYAGKQLSDRRTLAYYDILEESSLHLVLQSHIYVKTMDGRTITLKVGSRETIDDVKAKIQKEEGTPPHLQCLIFGCRVLKGSRTLSDYQVYEKATLILRLEAPSQPNVTSHRASKEATLHIPSKRPSAGVAPEQTKRARPATQISPSIQGLATSADRQALASARSNEKELSAMTDTLFVLCKQMSVFLKDQTKKTEEALRVAHKKEKELEATNSRLAFEHKLVSSLKAEKGKIEEELVVARNKEKRLQATMSELTHKNTTFSAQCTSYESQIVALEVDGKKTKQVLIVAHSKEKELEATISRLKTENKKTEEELEVARSKEKEVEGTISKLKAENEKTEEELVVARSKEKEVEDTISKLKAENEKTEEELVVARSKEKEVEDTISKLKAENEKTEEELTVARIKKKELEATVSRLRHKYKVFSAQCATYGSQVDALETDNKKTKEELMVADKKYSGAWAAGYAEGLKEGKAKWLKSVEFFHHLTDASMQYFDYGFDSCQKQAEQQGFVGQLNKDSSLKEAPELKGWECSTQLSKDANLEIPMVTEGDIVVVQKTGCLNSCLVFP